MANDEERFHVMFAADDIKELTLDQLDDAYRLDVIDDSTMIWQEGFDGWKTLAQVLAGDDDDVEDAEPVEDVSDWADVAGSQFKPQASAPLNAPSYYPSPSQQPAPSQRPVASQLAMGSSQYAAPGPLAQSQYPAAAPSQYPTQTSQYPTQASQYAAQSSQYPAAPQSPRPVASQYPAQASQYPAQASQYPASQYQTASQYPAASQYPFAPSSIPSVAPLSTRAVTFDPTELEPQAASPWFKRVLIVAAAAGALLVAQRGGLINSFAKAVDQGKSADALEAKVLGSPAVDTPRGLDAKLADIQSRYQLDKLSYTDPLAAPKAAEAAATAEKASETAKSESGSAAAAPAAATPTKAQDAMAERMQNAFAGKPTKPAAVARPTARPAAKSKGSKLGVGTNGGNEYDPMNGKL